MAGGSLVGRATFTCRACERAALVSLVVGPSPAHAGVAVRHSLAVEAGPVSVTIGGSVVDDRVREIAAALEAGDAEALYAIDLEFAPFWCPTCAATYCGDHWESWLEFDPDDPGWLDEQRGRCPLGHERMLFD